MTSGSDSDDDPIRGRKRRRTPRYSEGPSLTQDFPPSTARTHTTYGLRDVKPKNYRVLLDLDGPDEEPDHKPPVRSAKSVSRDTEEPGKQRASSVKQANAASVNGQPREVPCWNCVGDMYEDGYEELCRDHPSPGASRCLGCVAANRACYRIQNAEVLSAASKAQNIAVQRLEPGCFIIGFNEAVNKAYDLRQQLESRIKPAVSHELVPERPSTAPASSDTQMPTYTSMSFRVPEAPMTPLEQGSVGTQIAPEGHHRPADLDELKTMIANLVSGLESAQTQSSEKLELVLERRVSSLHKEISVTLQKHMDEITRKQNDFEKRTTSSIQEQMHIIQGHCQGLATMTPQRHCMVDRHTSPMKTEATVNRAKHEYKQLSLGDQSFSLFKREFKRLAREAMIPTEKWKADFAKKLPGRLRVEMMRLEQIDEITFEDYEKLASCGVRRRSGSSGALSVQDVNGDVPMLD